MVIADYLKIPLVSILCAVSLCLSSCSSSNNKLNDELDQSDKTTYAFARRMELQGLKVISRERD